MSIKTIAIVAAVILLVGAGWFFRDAPAMRETADSVAGFGKSILPDNKYTVVRAENEKNAGRSEKAGGAGALRKCIQDARTIYTDEKCPPGSREAPIAEGNVTVVPSSRPVEKPKGEEKSK